MFSLFKSTDTVTFFDCSIRFPYFNIVKIHVGLDIDILATVSMMFRPNYEYVTRRYPSDGVVFADALDQSPYFECTVTIRIPEQAIRY